MSSLLATKLHRPAVPPKRVPRPHLVQRLNEGLASSRQLTLVSAPAGFGKTTCISDWVNALDVPVTWLSLDPTDDDPGRFFTYLVAALQRVDANLGREIEGVLRAGQLPPIGVVSATLINDILDLESRFLLVLDDFQVIQDGFILQVLEQLVNNPPQPLHLVLLTREDPSLPLARLRANNQLTEIRAGDLRFTSREADRFLNEVMGLSLSQADIGALEDRTEGWIAGLHLAGLSVRDRADPSGFIATLSGSHRFILSYLTEEVLGQQSEDIQHFLLQTSILDRLSGELCNAVTGRTDSHSLLERLLNANLFLIPLDDERRWYRYHHLFADLLRDLQSTRQKDEMAELHRRASQWYARAGRVSEAIQHALPAGDYATAVRLIEDHAMDMLMQWHIKTVDGWMQSIPPAWCAQSPTANLAFAWMLMMRGDYTRAAPYLQRLQALFSDSEMSEETEEPSLKAKWLAIQTMLLNAQAKPAESVALGSQALDIAPEEDGRVRSLIYLGLAGAYQQLDDYAQAVDAFQMIIQYAQAATNSVSELLGISGLALLAIQRGQLHFAFELASQGIERVERSGSLPPISMAVYGELGSIQYHWHHLEQAHKHFQRAIQVSALSGYSDAELYYGVILSRLFQIQGDLETAAREIQKAVDLMRVEAPAVVREEVISQQVRIYLAQDNLAAAEAALKDQGFSFQGGFSFPDLDSGQQIVRPVAVLYISALRILLYRAQAKRERANLKPGIELADHLIAGALQRQYIPFALETLLARAKLYAALGNEPASQADCIRALELGEPEGFISIFVEEGPQARLLIEDYRLKILDKRFERDEAVRDRLLPYLARILESFPSAVTPSTHPPSINNPTPLRSGGYSQRSPIDNLLEPLTDRELDVLRLMAEGLKYEEIAARLFISLNTVRSHVKAIYDKLNVKNRVKAIDVARRLHLL
ncbi:MAG TPA: LuxR C-terminal-related transcriptional regulator [Anaerolineae bacterium]|nr:LuxR C-terminal-related transcriptional regulator [Anaerolineae bacterium]